MLDKERTASHIIEQVAIFYFFLEKQVAIIVFY